MTRGSLTVPANVRKIEADLKKEWNKKEREAKKVVKASSDAAAAPAKGTKRKAEQVSTNVSVNVSVEVSSTGAVKVGANQPAAKRTKTAAPKEKKTAAPTEKKTTATKEKKTTATKAQVNATGRSALSSKAARPAAKAKAPAKPATRQPAASRSGGNIGSSAAFEPYQAGYDDDEGDDNRYGYIEGSDNGYDDGYGDQESLPPAYSAFDPRQAPASPVRRSIGLLNGRYSVSCPYIEDNFPERLGDLGLIATLDGNKLWLKFDFGPAVTGLMNVDRPYEPDEEGIMVLWRGHALDGASNRRFVNVDTDFRAGPMNQLYFLGGGHIRGSISFDRHEIDFDAYRLPGQPMTSEISATQARAEWVQLE